MPKNRHKGPAAPAQNNADNSLFSGYQHPGTVRFALASLAVLVALAFAGWLSFESLGLLKEAGCGEEGGCGAAAESIFGGIALGESYRWPVSFLGFAHYIAIGAGLFLNRRGFTRAFKAITLLGGLVSLFYIVVIVLKLDEYFCWKCLTSHIANFVFVGAVLSAPIEKSRPSAFKTLAVIGAVFILATGALAGTKAAADASIKAKAKADAEDSTAKIIERSQGSDGASTTTNSDPPDEVAVNNADLPATAYTTDGQGFTGRYRLGPKDAKVRIVIFSSYICPFCTTLEEEMLEIMSSRDDVSYSHKHYPLDKECNSHILQTAHPRACQAATIAEAMGELHGPDAFWRYHKSFYKKMRDKEQFNASSLINELGYNGREVALYAKNSREMEDRVKLDIDEAVELGLDRTPTIFINGEEFRGWNVRGSLRRAVDTIADQVPAGTPEMDSPVDGKQKRIDDYFASTQRLRAMGTDAIESFLGEADAPIDMDVFFAYESDDLFEYLRAFETIREKYPQAVRMTLRHFPRNEDCNPHWEYNRVNNSCAMHRALEAAAVLGGNQAFGKAYAWLLQVGESFDEALLPELAAEIGVSTEELVSTMESSAVGDALVSDAAWLSVNGKPGRTTRAVYPIVYINGRRVSRYTYNDDHVSILDGVIRGELGLDQ